MLTLKRSSVLWLIASSITVVAFYFLARTIVLHKAIDGLSSKLANSYQLQLNIGKTSFVGIKSLRMEQVCITGNSNDTVFYSDTLFFQLRFWHLFLGKVRLRKFYIANTQLNISNNLISNILHKQNTTEVNPDTSKTNYAEVLDNICNTLFSIIPTEIKIGNATLKYSEPQNKLDISCPSFELNNGFFSGSLQLSDALTTSHCNITGQIDRIANMAILSIAASKPGNVTLPYIASKWNTGISFDSLLFSFNYEGKSWDVAKFKGNGSAYNLRVTNRNLAPSPVTIDSSSISFQVNAGERYVELDSLSVIKLNQFAFSPYFKIDKTESTIFECKIPAFEFAASSLFESFPNGLFSSIRDMKVSGYLSYFLTFQIDWQHPDSIILNSELKAHNFNINQYGMARLTMLNDTFKHTVFEHDTPVTNIFVSPESNNFVALNNISHFLKYAVLTSEDGDFYYHKGFNEEAFRNSVSENIKKRRFARGGSTLTMQLVKNVFLTRNKTVSRKIEEILMVWMIENMHLVTKDRMFEVYLNIIEWGPGIYGIKPAAMYYFKKSPSELTLSESIFLASIIPSPKYFKYAFDEHRKLKESYKWYFHRLPEVMLKRNQIEAADTIGLLPEITIVGKATSAFLTPDTIAADSTTLNPYEPLF